MKRPIKMLLIPAVLIAGLITLASDKAEAHRRFRLLPRRHHHRVYVHPPAVPMVRVPAPPMVRVPVLPRVHVHAPGVHVDVAPRAPWHWPGGSVVAPGVHVRW